MAIISTLSSLQKSLSSRQRIATQDRQVQQAQTELVTGFKTDIYTDRSFRSAQTLDLRNRMARVEAYAVSNKLLAGKMSVMSEVTTSVRSEVQKFMAFALTYGDSGSAQNTVKAEAESVLKSLSAQFNTVYSGEYLFSGENAGMRSLLIPEAGFTTGVTAVPQSAAQAAADIATIDRYFGLNASATTPTQSSAFELEAYPSGSKVKARSKIDEHTSVSFGTNIGDESIRQIMKGITMLAQIDVSEFTDAAAKQAWLTEANSALSTGISSLQQHEIELGNQQSMLETQIQRQDALRTLYNSRVVDIEGVDSYEAATRFESLSTQLETSYAVTARLRSLTLLSYL